MTTDLNQNDKRVDYTVSDGSRKMIINRNIIPTPITINRNLELMEELLKLHKNSKHDEKYESKIKLKNAIKKFKEEHNLIKKSELSSIEERKKILGLKQNHYKLIKGFIKNTLNEIKFYFFSIKEIELELDFIKTNPDYLKIINDPELSIKYRFKDKIEELEIEISNLDEKINSYLLNHSRYLKYLKHFSKDMA